MVQTRDAIEWIADARDLLPLVPRHWMQNAMRDFRHNHKFWRSSAEDAWYSDVGIGYGFKGVRLIYATGEIPYHTDPDFPHYGYLLIIRPAGYIVTGHQWRGDRPQAPGDLICFHQQRRQHALVRRGRDEKEMKTLSRETMVWTQPHPGRLWMGLIWDHDELSPVDEVSDVFRDVLESVQRRNQTTVRLTTKVVDRQQAL